MYTETGAVAGAGNLLEDYNKTKHVPTGNTKLENFAVEFGENISSNYLK